MENVSDALKMAGAAMLFVLAFTISMIMFSRAKQTADIALTNLQLSKFLPKIESLDKNVTRIVGIETVIPSIYRYNQQDANIRIRICKKTGPHDVEELQVFDAGLEETAHGEKPSNDSEEEKIYYNSVVEKYGDPSKSAYMYKAPWYNQNAQYTLERINSYIYGIDSKLMPELKYKAKDNYLMKYADKKFEESYVEYRLDGNIFMDKTLGEEIVITPAKTTKTIITYTIID